MFQKWSYREVHTECDGKPSHDRIEPKLALFVENPRTLVAAQGDYKDCNEDKGNQISRQCGNKQPDGLITTVEIL